MAFDVGWGVKGKLADPVQEHGSWCLCLQTHLNTVHSQLRLKVSYEFYKTEEIDEIENSDITYCHVLPTCMTLFLLWNTKEGFVVVVVVFYLYN